MCHLMLKNLNRKLGKFAVVWNRPKLPTFIFWIDIRVMFGKNNVYTFTVPLINPTQNTFFFWWDFLHLHEIVEGLYFHCSLSVCLCVCVCLSVCLSGNSCEQNSSRTDAPIWTRFSLNGCFPHWLGPYWIWWPWVKGKGHSDVIPIFSS